MNQSTMKYWDNPNLEKIANTASAEYLMKNGDGKCGAWAKLFKETTAIQGFDDVKLVDIYPYPYLSTIVVNGRSLKITGLVVKSNALSPPGPPGLPGQGPNPNPQYAFKNHQVVVWGATFPLSSQANVLTTAQADVTAKIWDPSYGKPYNSTRAWETASLYVILGAWTDDKSQGTYVERPDAHDTTFTHP